MIRVGRVLLLLLANLIVFALCEAAYRTWIYLRTPRPDPAVHRFEIYGVGESTMVGQPFSPKISIPRLLEIMFEGHAGGRPIELHNIAEPGVPLYPQSLAFARAMASRNEHAPGVALIMAGHNERIRPRHSEAVDTSVVSALMERSAMGRDMLLALRRKRLIPLDQTLAAYDHYLRQIIETAQGSGLVPIVATMASNISRIEPNYDRDDAAVREIVARGLLLENQQRYAEARDLYLGGLRGRDHARAPLEYQAARCEEALGNHDAARELYWAAVDHDPRTLFGRTTRPQNEVVRRLAREYNIPLVDTVAIFESHSPHGILSPTLFADGQHPSLAGYVLLANAFAEIIASRFDTEISHPLRDVDAVVAAVHFSAEDMRESMVDAASWLIATSVDHPSPRDRMALAMTIFQGALGKGDDFSAWVGLGLGQAALRGGLRSNDVLARVCRYNRRYNLPPEDAAITAERLAALGVDADIVEHVRLGKRYEAQ